MVVRFIDESIPVAFNPPDPPIIESSPDTLTGDLVIIFLLVYSNDPVTVTPQQTGFTLIEHLRVNGFILNGIHYTVWAAEATSNGSTSYDFSEAFSYFSSPDNGNYIGCYVLRGQDASWLADSSSAQREGCAGDPDTLAVSGVGAFPNLTLNFNPGLGPIPSCSGAMAFNMDIVPSDFDVAGHYNLLIGFREWGQTPSYTVTPDSGPSYSTIDNGSNGANTGCFAFGLGPVVPVSYNCTEEGCVDPGDGSGTYGTLEECLAACGIPASYNCVDGVCVDPGDGSGEFATLLECQTSGCGTISDGLQTMRFDAGTGVEWYLVAPISDSGNELQSKVVKAVRATGKLTNASAMIFGYDIHQPIVTEYLEQGTRLPVQMTTRPQSFEDSTNVAQTMRKPVNIKNAVLHTVRVSGDDREQAERDRLDEVVYEVAIEGCRR